MYCAWVTLRGEMLIKGDIVGGIFAAPFDGNVMVGDVVGEMLLADIVFGDDVPCNSNARGRVTMEETTCHAIVILQGEMLMGSNIAGGYTMGE